MKQILQYSRALQKNSSSVAGMFLQVDSNPNSEGGYERKTKQNKTKKTRKSMVFRSLKLIKL